MDRLRYLDTAYREDGGTRSKGNPTQSSSMRHVIGDHPAAGRQDRIRVCPIAQEGRDLEKLVSLVKHSSDRTTLLALSAALDAEIESLSKQVATVQANLAAESQRKPRQTTLESMARSTAAEHAKSAWVPLASIKVLATAPGCWDIRQSGREEVGEWT